MAANEYEPSAEAVEALAIQLRNEWNNATFLNSLDGCSAADDWRRVAASILHRQHARELALTSAMGRAIKSLEANFDHPSWAVAYLTEALAAHAKLDAPKVPTLLEAAKAVASGVADAVRYSINGEHLAALKAAVEREDRGK